MSLHVNLHNPDRMTVDNFTMTDGRRVGNIEIFSGKDRIQIFTSPETAKALKDAWDASHVQKAEATQ